MQGKLIVNRQSDSEDVDDSHSARPEFAVKHYSVGELAKLWNLSEDTVRAMFSREPGVIEIPPQNGKKYSKRRYRTLRIPEPVAARVYERRKKTA